MALTTGDLQAIQGAIDASAQATTRTLIDYMDGRLETAEVRIKTELRQEIQESEERMYNYMDRRFGAVYEHVSDVANGILGAVGVVTDNHERCLTRLEHRRAA